MSSRPSLLRRWDQTGVPLLIARLVLGGLLVWMGLAKTGLPKQFLNKTGLIETATVQRMVEMQLIVLDGPQEFLKLIHEYEMFGDSGWLMMNFVAVVVPWVEVICGLLLIVGAGVRGSSLLLLLMLIGFTVVVAMRAIHIYNTTDIAFCAIAFDCGCGSGEVLICRKLPENVGLCLLALLCTVSGSRRFCLRKDLIPVRGSNSRPSATRP